jgi:glycosyltransferase involved in cell wall biosynthesis
VRIGINGRFLVAKRTGVQRAAFNLIRTLVEIDRDNEYLIFTGHGQAGRPEWNYSNVQVIESELRESESVMNHIWEQFWLPVLARRYRVDLLHSPANVAPLLYRGTSVVHIHDLCFVVNPQWYSFMFRTVYNFIIPRLARRASRVITCSNNSRNDLMHFCQLPAEKVSLVYWAVDDTFLGGKPEGGVAQESLRESLGEFVLYVGSLEPRKNINTLIEAYVKMRRENPELKHKLVLVGGESPLFADVQLRVKDFAADIVFKGFIDDETLRRFYLNASLVAYPSLYEGFGLPPLEAMASGTPVVTSAGSSLPEVVGDAALMVNPLSADELTSAMVRMLTDRELRASFIARGFRQVERFNWYRVARNTLAVYYEVVNEARERVASGRSRGGKNRKFVPFNRWKDLVALENRHLSAIRAKG